MTWFVPPLEGRPKRFSNYKDVDADSSQYFILQKRKERKGGAQVRKGHRAPFRIITKGDPFYEVAYTTSLEECKATEWDYICNRLPELIPSNIRGNPVRVERWIVAHFTLLASDGGQQGDGLCDSSDEESAGALSGYRSMHRRSMSRPSSPGGFGDREGSSSSSSSSNGAGILPGILLPLSGLPAYVVLALSLNASVLLVRDSSQHSFLVLVLALNVSLMLLVLCRNRGSKTALSLHIGADPVLAAQEAAKERRQRRRNRAQRTVLAKVEKEGVERPVTVPAAMLQPAEASSFRVRLGPNYKKTRTKAPSGPTLAHCVGADLFKTKKKPLGLCKHVVLPRNPHSVGGAAGGDEQYIVLHFMVPDYPAAMMGRQDDGPGYSIVLYFVLTEDTKRALKDLGKASPAVKLLARYMEHCKNPPSGKGDLRGRMKAIPRVDNANELSVGQTLKTLLSKYNATPFMTGPTCHSYYTGKNFIEIDVDVHRYCYLARRAASGLKEHLSAVDLALACVVQGDDDEELPETLLGAIQVKKLKLSQARDLASVYPEFGSR